MKEAHRLKGLEEEAEALAFAEAAEEAAHPGKHRHVAPALGPDGKPVDIAAAPLHARLASLASVHAEASGGAGRTNPFDKGDDDIVV